MLMLMLMLMFMFMFMVIHSFRGEVGQPTKNFWKDGGDERDRSRHVVAMSRGDMKFRDPNGKRRTLYAGSLTILNYP
jgi:hypothetical protein